MGTVEQDIARWRERDRLRQRVETERAAQGLSMQITDRGVLRQLVTITDTIGGRS